MKIHPELLTIRDYIRYAASCFNQAGLYFGHGTDNAWDDAVALILHSLHLPHDITPAILDARLTAEEAAKLTELIHRRTSERIPIPYLTHEAWFANLSFYVDERVLIPRSPMAELIEQQFSPWVENPDEVEDILDLCTGSGCIAIACAHAFPQARVDASDISADALAVAKINVLRHEMSEQVYLHQSDLFSDLPTKQYDIIVSNPPYVSTTEMASLPDEYRHEPTLGLAAGIKGLDVVKRIIENASRFLKPTGILVVEVGNSEMALEENYPGMPFVWPDFSRSQAGGVFILSCADLKK